MDRTLATWIVAIVGPFLVTTIHIVLSRWENQWYPGGHDYDFVALALSVAVGLAAIATLKTSIANRVFYAATYAIFATAAVGYFSTMLVYKLFG